ncbi:HAMP domain-containing sensor histidine kinase [Labrys monachus]|uniref:histidine kinase n=1 Tax=Labrys monachus TaxID=217067 RepID=A0ABU0FCD7_9HYPH|nr:HAMP domain-containing sensor histidine kinase [Labrys monachus]MDQ0392270.1 signal transduction histidine kinase [Labrys monachus]
MLTFFRKRLFWQVYLTLLACLLLLALLVGALLHFTGESPEARWDAFRVRLTDELAKTQGLPHEGVRAAVRELSQDLGAAISVYGPDRVLIAAQGRPIPLSAGEDEVPQRWRDHVVRVDLPEGRIVLARLPPPEPGLRILTLVLLVAGGVGIAAYPATARLTRRLEQLRTGVESWGSGALARRVPEQGRDEVAMVAHSFNGAADRIEALVNSQKALLANASHELRSPLARLRMAIEIWSASPGAAREEITRNLAEIDQLVEEILLASRLDYAGASPLSGSQVDLLGLAAEEAARTGAGVDGTPVEIYGDATLLRRLMRNLLENAGKHGRPPVEITVSRAGDRVRIAVADRGPGISETERKRLFEPFYRPAGRSEMSGGWGLGLALVRQIAGRHHGTVRCETRDGGGSVFVVELPIAAS